MRKTIIALILILPLLFVFAIFSSVNFASMGVEIAANGISIVNKSEFANGALRIDLADQANFENKLEVSVLPENATNKGYTFKVEELEGSDLADVSIDSQGVITAHSEGAARISAVSNDGGYRDSVTVLVSSSKAYDFDFELFNEQGKIDLNVDQNGNYFASVNSGRYTYATNVYPGAFTVANVQIASGSVALLKEGARSLTLPFSGVVVLTVTVPNGVNGDIVKTVTLNVSKTSTPSGITVNGEAGNIIALADGAEGATFYVEADSEPELSASYGIQSVLVQNVDGLANCYIISVELADNIDEDFSAILSSGANQIELNFTFKAFDFSLNADLTVSQTDNDYTISILSGTPTNFYAVAAVETDDLSYIWGVDSLDYTDEILSIDGIGATCTVNATQNGAFLLWVEAYRKGVPTGIVKEITVNVISHVYGIQITNDTTVDLAARYTIGGLKYNEAGQTEQNKYLLDVLTYYQAGGNDGIRSVSDLDCTVSDTNKATVEIDGQNVWLVPQGTGEVTVTFAWKGNLTFKTNHVAVITVNVVRNGVEVNNAPDLVKATSAGVEVVLTGDITLGTDKNGNVLSIDTRREMLGSMKSTYNIEWYKNGGLSKTEADAYVKFVMEFKDDVYGNGHYINAEHFTNAKDGTGMPLLFKGPLFFVSMGDMASVAGQDNIAFLIRSDGVTLYGVNLLGCSDQSLINDSGNYDLTNLNYVGTVLEVNADAQIVNCRIRNGRNVVRVYGGNRDGNKYFIDSLAENANGVSEDERINVVIQGCIISQAREFLVKTGANKALRASEAEGGQSPSLLDGNENAYQAQTDAASSCPYINDEYFYQHYVMTDLTLKDSVLETSGLFAISVESNFSGKMLYKDASGESFVGTEEWRGSGGTSFAVALRLEGDVRLYDWKDIALVDSSVLIEANSGALSWLKLDIASMIDHVSRNEQYSNIIHSVEGKRFVHGGMVTYGGGKNYAQIDTSKMKGDINEFNDYKIKISILKDSDDNILSMQGVNLPSAAGDEAFRFYMYGADSEQKNAISYQDQLNDGTFGNKYDGVKPFNVF